MDITPTPLGARVDVTDDAVAAVVEMLAEAFVSNETGVAQLLTELVDARSALHNLQVSTRAGRCVSDERIERTACEVDGIRDALAAMLSGRVTIQLTSAGCRQDAAKLNAAAQAVENRFRTPGQIVLPRQQDRSAA